MSPQLLEAIRREAFVQGYIARRDPKTPHETLKLLPEADKAYEAWVESRKGV